MWSKHFIFSYENLKTCPRSLTEKKGFAVQIHIKNVGKNQLEVKDYISKDIKEYANILY